MYVTKIIKYFNKALYYATSFGESPFAEVLLQIHICMSIRCSSMNVYTCIVIYSIMYLYLCISTYIYLIIWNRILHNYTILYTSSHQKFVISL